jgi:hypothetical protein
VRPHLWFLWEAEDVNNAMMKILNEGNLTEFIGLGSLKFNGEGVILN